jgi:hypothetical protein
MISERRQTPKVAACHWPLISIIGMSYYDFGTTPRWCVRQGGRDHLTERFAALSMADFAGRRSFAV